MITSQNIYFLALIQFIYEVTTNATAIERLAYPLQGAAKVAVAGSEELVEPKAGLAPWVPITVQVWRIMLFCR